MNKSYFFICCGLLVLSFSLLGFYSCTENSIQPTQESNAVRIVEEDECDIDAPGSGIQGPAVGNIVSFIVELALSPLPQNNNFTREISFRSALGDWKKVSVSFQRTSSTSSVWTGSTNMAGFATLLSLNQTGNRWFQDDMYIENNGGSNVLSITRIRIVVKYPQKTNFITEIPIVSTIFSPALVLTAPTGRINLNQASRDSRVSFAGITQTYFNTLPLNLRAAIHDLGKTGSDGGHGMMDNDNPKYDIGTSVLCSEFVSWYMYAAKITITGASGTVYNFKDIGVTGTAYNQFFDASRVYYFNKTDGIWYKVPAPSNPYTPKPGDWLMRKRYVSDGGSGQKVEWHSMILFEWDNNNKIAKVINGPWPVTIRTVEVGHLVAEHNYHFYIGKIPPND